jgi:hypothetical protein
VGLGDVVTFSDAALSTWDSSTWTYLGSGKSSQMCISGFSATHPGALLLEVRGTEGQDTHLIMARAFDMQVRRSHGCFLSTSLLW